MIEKTTILKDTTAGEDVSIDIELTIDDGILIDVIFNCNEPLDSDDKMFAIWDAIDELGLDVEIIDIKQFTGA